jgi:hypothetical protein
MSEKKGSHGGKRKGAGRKSGFKLPKSKLKERTKVMRIPVKLVEAVEELIERYNDSKS